MFLLLFLTLHSLCLEKYYLIENLEDTCDKITPNAILNLNIIIPVEIKNEIIRVKMTGTRYNRCKVYNTINLGNLNKVYKNIKAKDIIKINIDDIKKNITEFDCYNFLTFINQFTEKDLRIITRFSRSFDENIANIFLHNDTTNKTKNDSNKLLINDLDKIVNNIKNSSTRGTF